MNGNNQGFNEENRYELRKRKRMNRILNASILAVGALIVFFAIQLFLPGSEEASNEENQENQETEQTEEAQDNQTDEEQTAPEDNPQTDNQEETPESEDSSDTATEDSTNEQQDQSDESDESSNNTNEQDSSDSNDAVSTPDSDVEEGEWEPIGTEQSGSFTHNFDEGSQNWEEMEAALRYATGLSKEEMQTWRIENGGGTHKVVGTVSNSANVDTPYQVTMEFIEDEGWKPLEVERLDSNPYTG